jgi:hypothetical protein
VLNDAAPARFQLFSKKKLRAGDFFGQPRRPPPVDRGKEPPVTKPPPTTPHSDLDGVHRDERPNVETAEAAGEGGADLARARDEGVGRPPASEDGPNRDDRSG